MALLSAFSKGVPYVILCGLVTDYSRNTANVSLLISFSVVEYMQARCAEGSKTMTLKQAEHWILKIESNEEKRGT